MPAAAAWLRSCAACNDKHFSNVSRTMRRDSWKSRSKSPLMVGFKSGLKSMLFCLPFTIKDQCKQISFQHLHNQVLFQFFTWTSLSSAAPDGVFVSLSFESKSTRQVNVAWRAQCQLKKSPLSVRDRDKGVARRNGRAQCFPGHESLFWL